MNRYRVVLCGAPKSWWASIIISMEANSVFFISEITQPDTLKEVVMQIQPAVLLWNLSGMEHLSLIEEINHQCPFTFIVVMVPEDGDFDLMKLVQAGIRGCLPLYLLPQHMVKAVELIMVTGITCLPRLKADFFNPKSQFSDNGLTEREKEVLALIKNNYSNRQIALSLCISESTVKTHLSNAFKKIGVRNRNEALTLMMAGTNHL